MSTWRRIAAIALGAGIAVLALAPLAGPFDEAAFSALLRLSGRLSFILWLVSFFAGPLNGLRPSPISKLALKHRRDFGLMFAGSHLVHAILLAAVVVLVPDLQFPLYVVIGGGLGFAFIAAMAITSFETPARALGTARWRRLHTIGTWYISGIFTLDFILTPILQNRLFEAVYLPFALLLLAAYALRVTYGVRARARSAW